MAVVKIENPTKYPLKKAKDYTVGTFLEILDGPDAGRICLITDGGDAGWYLVDIKDGYGWGEYITVAVRPLNPGEIITITV